MPDERYTFETARIRLEEIAAEVRKKDTSLEKSLELLEEGVRLANICTELVDRADVSSTGPQAAADDVEPASPAASTETGPADEAAEGAEGPEATEESTDDEEPANEEDGASAEADDV
jgi:exodeoxyribonuclease VII small subunit